MRGRRTVTIVAFGVLALVGCRGGMGSRRTLASREPPLVTGDPDGASVAQARPAPPEFVERHPLLRKPREVYDASGNNKIVKVAGATLVGVPMGIVGEIRQIFVGAPPATPKGF